MKILVNVIFDVVWFKDIDGIYFVGNFVFEEYFGWYEFEFFGFMDYDLFVFEVVGKFFNLDC